MNQESLAGFRADSEKGGGLSEPPILEQIIDISKIVGTHSLLGFIRGIRKFPVSSPSLFSL
jgi:hypothetical protein